jgi:hypothetical protein
VLVRLAAVVLAALGLVGLYFGLPGDRWLLIGGVVLLALAPTVWVGFRFARVPAAIVALLASWPLVYGLWGLTVVAGEYGDCRDGRIGAVASFTSYPADYCNIVDWAGKFGVGFGLIGLGLAGLFVFAVVMRNAEHFKRTLRLAS